MAHIAQLLFLQVKRKFKLWPHIHTVVAQIHTHGANKCVSIVVKATKLFKTLL